MSQDKRAGSLNFERYDNLQVPHVSEKSPWSLVIRKNIRPGLVYSLRSGRRFGVFKYSRADTNSSGLDDLNWFVNVSNSVFGARLYLRMHALISGGAPAQISAITALSSAIVCLIVCLVAKSKTEKSKIR